MHKNAHTHTQEMVWGERGLAHRSEFTELGNRVKGRRWDERAQQRKREKWTLQGSGVKQIVLSQ